MILAPPYYTGQFAKLVTLCFCFSVDLLYHRILHSFIYKVLKDPFICTESMGGRTSTF